LGLAITVSIVTLIKLLKRKDKNDAIF